MKLGLTLVNKKMDEFIDKKIADNYEILERIGTGGYATVYKAYQTTLKRTVAIKILHSQLIDDEQSVLHFQKEAEIASRIVHPHVVRAFDRRSYKDLNLSFMAMDYVDGVSLKEVLALERQKRRSELNIEQSIKIIIQLCNGLSAVHKERIIHCDIKPANIKLTNENSDPNFVKLLDFGIAVDKSDKSLEELTRIDRPGTSQYMSPEQCRLKELAHQYAVHPTDAVLKELEHLAEKFDYRSDIYSAGCVLHESLTGHPPYEGGSAAKTEQMHQTEKIPDLELDTSHPIIKSQLANIVSTALAKNPDMRYQSADQLGTALESVLLQINDLKSQKTNKALLAIKQLGQWLFKMARKFPNRMNFLFLLMFATMGLIACIYIPESTDQLLNQGVELRPLICKLTKPAEMDQSVNFQLAFLGNEKICEQIKGAQSFKNEGNFNAAIIGYQDALCTADSLNINHTEVGAEIKSELALCFLFEGNVSKARQISEEALDILRNLGYYDSIKALLASLTRAQALVLSNQDNLARAEFQHMKRTLLGADVKRRFDQVAYAESYWADFLRKHGEVEESESYYKSAEQRWAGFEGDGAYNRCAVLDQMALLNLTNKQFNLARNCLIKALASLESSSEHTSLANAQLAFHMAKVDWEQHNYLSATFGRIQAKEFLKHNH